MNHNGNVIAQRDGLTVINCRLCGFAHLHPLPGADTLARFYETDFWQTEKPGEVARAQDQAEWLAATYADWLTVIEERVPGRTMLDVGCGYGWFLQAAALREWRVAGIEPSKPACEYLASTLNIPIANKSWESCDPGPVDVIAVHWVIEHVPEPAAFLRWCRGNLYSGGAFLLVCPNEWTQAQWRANHYTAKENYWLDHTHINYFSQSALSNLLGRCGFRVTDWLATEPMEQFLINRRDYTIDPALGRECHREIEIRDLSWTREERLVHYRELGGFGHGRDIVCVAVPEG